MPERNPKSRSPGSSSPLTKIVPIVVIVIGLAVVGYFYLQHGRKTAAPTAASGQPATTTPAPAASANAPAAQAPATPAQELSVDELIKQASTAFHEQRYVAPAGNNAVEAYLQVLAKDPNNQIAKDALREMFPFATGAVEQEINASNLDEATREIDLLAKADPSNYTLTILRGKLDAKKKQAENAQKLQEAAAAAAAAAAAKEKAAAEATAQQQTASAEPAAPDSQAAANPTPVPAVPTPAPATPVAPPQPVGETHPAELVKYVPPVYPPGAYRRRQSGWVEVIFTVSPDGKVTNAKVGSAEPARVFNRAALNAVRGWTFKPRMENGKAVSEQVTRRIEFKLASG